jgi:hypothetical protein
MSNMKLFIALLLVVYFRVGGHSSCRAGVEWTSRDLSAQASLGAEVAEFVYYFNNTGNLPVQFELPVASCGCTLAKWDKSIYAPRESGSLKGTYGISGRHGLNSVTIAVKGAEIDGGVSRPFADTLKLSVFVPEIVTVSPGIVLWRKDSALTPKVIRFEVNKALALPLMLKALSNEAFIGEWTTVAEGRTYDLKVTPNSTAEAKQAMITVEGINKDGKTLRFYAHLMIR